MTDLDLLRRCCEAPELHLAKTSLFQFNAYEIGYEMRCDCPFERTIDIEAVNQAIWKDYRIPPRWPCSLNVNFFLTAAEGEAGALSKFLQYCEHVSPLAEPKIWRESKMPPGYLLELFGRTDFRQRQGLYFGNRGSSEHLWSVISGACWAERDESGGDGSAGEVCGFMERFQKWIEQRYRYFRGVPWHRSLLVDSGFSYEESSKTFYDCFDRFMAGDPPDSDRRLPT